MGEWFRDPGTWLFGMAGLGLLLIGIGAVYSALNPPPPLTQKEWQVSDKFGLNCTCKEWRQ